MPVMAEMRALDAIGDEHGVLRPMKSAPRVEDPWIEDDTISWIGRHPLGVQADEIHTAQTGDHIRQGTGPVMGPPFGSLLARRSPMAAFDESELEPAFVEALEV